MKIVLDTNVLVSGLLQPFGPSGQIVRLLASGQLTLCYDSRILAEYRDVLFRRKFAFNPERVESLLEEIRAAGIPIAARPLVTRLPDPDDEIFLEIALASPCPNPHPPREAPQPLAPSGEPAGSRDSRHRRRSAWTRTSSWSAAAMRAEGEGP